MINYLLSGINILAQDDPIPIKLGPKGTTPNRKDACFMFYTQSVIADLLVRYASASETLDTGTCTMTSCHAV